MRRQWRLMCAVGGGGGGGAGGSEGERSSAARRGICSTVELCPNKPPRTRWRKAGRGAGAGGGWEADNGGGGELQGSHKAHRPSHRQQQVHLGGGSEEIVSHGQGGFLFDGGCRPFPHSYGSALRASHTAKICLWWASFLPLNKTLTTAVGCPLIVSGCTPTAVGCPSSDVKLCASIMSWPR